MTPIHLADYIDTIKTNLTNDVELLKGSVASIQNNIENKYEKIELQWLLTSVVNEVAMAKHHLFQLQKGLEKIASKS